MDSIADMLTRIRNALAVKKETVVIPYSRLKMEIAKIFVKEKLVKEAEPKGKKSKKIIEIVLAYKENGKPAITHLKRISKSSQRIYSPVKNLKSLRGGTDLRIISTPKGILTDREAKKEKVGGEVLCEVW